MDQPLTAIMTLASLGGPILSEKLTYSGLKSIAALREIPLEPVDMDEEGILPEALEAAHKKSNGRIVYLQPTVQNPLGCTMSLERREKVAEIARANDLIIIEDDVAAAGVTDRDMPHNLYYKPIKMRQPGTSRRVHGGADSTGRISFKHHSHPVIGKSAAYFRNGVRTDHGWSCRQDCKSEQ